MRRHQLDGLRFFLFIFVFLTHHFPQELEFFGYALPVFFVMSGFLITKVLLLDDQPTLLGKLRVFYVRRILRIFPAYYLVVGLLWAYGSLSFPWYYVSYLVNIKLYLMSLGPDIEAFTLWFAAHWRTDSVHLWSLSVEEQFYIVYPLLLYLTAARFRTGMLLAIIVLSILARTWFIENVPYSYYSALLPVCMEYFAWGCVFAWLESQNKLGRINPNVILPLSTILVVALITIEFHWKLDGFYQFQTTHFQSPIAMCLGFFIWSLWNIKPSHPAARFLSFKPFVYFGEMSYTMYLIHLFTWDLWPRLGIDLPFSAKANLMIGTWVLTSLLAMAIWHTVEKPANNLKRFIPYTHARR